MAVRVKLKLRSRTTGKELEVIALVNSGFETDKPKLLVPIKVAELLGLWPSIPTTYCLRDYFTAGGPIRKIVIPDELFVKIIVEYETPEVLCDLIISTIEDEVLISDKLASKLGIELIDIGEGIWRLKSDKENILRKSFERQIWI